MDLKIRDQVGLILNQVAAQFGIDDLHFSNNGVCKIRVDNKFDVFIEASKDTDHLRLFGVISALEEVRNGNQAYRLLCENLPSKEKGNNYIAISEETKELLLCAEVEAVKLDFNGLVDRLESFVNYLEVCLSQTQSPNSSNASKSTEVKMTNTTADVASASRSVKSAGTSVQARLLNQLQNAK